MVLHGWTKHADPQLPQLGVLGRGRLGHDEEDVDGFGRTSAAAPRGAAAADDADGGDAVGDVGPSDDGEAPAGELAPVQDDCLGVLRAEGGQLICHLVFLAIFEHLGENSKSFGLVGSVRTIF